MNMNLKSSTNPIPDLSSYRVTGYTPGAGILLRGLWHFINAMIFLNPLFCSYRIKNIILRVFGATIGMGVIIKPRVNIKHPWRLAIGDHSWIGENVWIDNLVNVTIGSNACVSQGACILTGNHDYKSSAFTLITKPVRIEDGAWVGARSVVCPGVIVGRCAVLTVGSILTRDAEPDGIYAGNPACKVKTRSIS